MTISTISNDDKRFYFNVLVKSRNPPASLLSWLTYQSSLTDKLKTIAGDAQLKVVNQQWVLPSWWDKFMLGLSGMEVMQRNIMMVAWQIPCWYARTIIPNATYQAYRLFFDRLKHESLGDLIYNEPKIKRNSINYEINSHCLEYHWLPTSLQAKNGQFWVRLSVFTIADSSPFYLVEILLPGLMRVSN
jgi:chorismate lyase